MMNATLVIFGASGDLTSRKLIPSLYRVMDQLGEEVRIVGFARSKFSDDAWREHLGEKSREFIPNFDEERWNRFAHQIFYQPGSLDSSEDIDALARRLETLEAEIPSTAQPDTEQGYTLQNTSTNQSRFLDDSKSMTGGRARVYYLATAPSLYAIAAQRLSAAGLVDVSKGPRRVVIEKPFGTDLASARLLNVQLHEVLDESQIFRIDHYLGKETVQNLLVFRFANEIFEPLWNREHIASVEITAMESVSVGHRGAYYERAGVWRDMIQNHLFQLLALTTMESPARLDADSIREEKTKIFRSIEPLGANDIPRSTLCGQYRGYHDEENVDQASRTPTFAALRLKIANRRWGGVPFFIRSGKSSSCTTTQIVVRFRRPPISWFGNACHAGSCDPNRLVIQIQPAEGIHLDFLARQPDGGMNVRNATLSFRFSGVPPTRLQEDARTKVRMSGDKMPEAYQRLLLDAMNGDASLFIRSDETESAWAVLDPIIHAYEGRTDLPLESYEPGSWGPDASARWIRSWGSEWYDLCPVL